MGSLQVALAAEEAGPGSSGVRRSAVRMECIPRSDAFPRCWLGPSCVPRSVPSRPRGQSRHRATEAGGGQCRSHSETVQSPEKVTLVQTQGQVLGDVRPTRDLRVGSEQENGQASGGWTGYSRLFLGWQEHRALNRRVLKVSAGRKDSPGSPVWSFSSCVSPLWFCRSGGLGVFLSSFPVWDPRCVGETSLDPCRASRVPEGRGVLLEFPVPPQGRHSSVTGSGWGGAAREFPSSGTAGARGLQAEESPSLPGVNCWPGIQREFKDPHSGEENEGQLENDCPTHPSAGLRGAGVALERTWGAHSADTQASFGSAFIQLAHVRMRVTSSYGVSASFSALVLRTDESSGGQTFSVEKVFQALRSTLSLPPLLHPGRAGAAGDAT